MKLGLRDTGEFCTLTLGLTARRLKAVKSKSSSSARRRLPSRRVVSSTRSGNGWDCWTATYGGGCGVRGIRVRVGAGVIERCVAMPAASSAVIMSTPSVELANGMSVVPSSEVGKLATTGEDRERADGCRSTPTLLSRT